jgi:hypothetical protein
MAPRDRELGGRFSLALENFRNTQVVESFERSVKDISKNMAIIKIFFYVIKSLFVSFFITILLCFK